MKKFKTKNFKLKTFILSLALTMFLGGGVISLIFANQNKIEDMKVTGVVNYIGSIYSGSSFDRAGLLSLKKAVDAGPGCLLGGSNNFTSVVINGDDYLVAYVSSGFVEDDPENEDSNKLNTEDTIVTLCQRYTDLSLSCGYSSYNNSYDQSEIRESILNLGSNRIGIPEEYLVGAGKLWWQRSYISRIDIDSEVYARRAIERKNDFIQVFGTYDFNEDDGIELPDWSMYDYQANGWEGDMYWIPSYTEIEDIWTDQTEESASWIEKPILESEYWLRTGTTESDLDAADNDGDGLVDFNDQSAYLVLDSGNSIIKTDILETGYTKLCFNLNLTKALAAERPSGYSDWRDYASEYFTEGNGSEYDPYLIYTAEDLALVSKLASEDDLFQTVCIKQMADIDLIGTPWYPILNFLGHYDGNGFTIYNMECTSSPLVISQESTPYYVNGLFGNCYSSHLDNIILDSGSAGVYGEENFTYVGGIVGFASSSRIKNCKNINGSVTGTTAGGIVGQMNGGNVENCINEASVNGPDVLAWVGGIVGVFNNYGNSALIYLCINRGFVIGNGYVGGICGMASSGCYINLCFNYGSLAAGFADAVPTYIGGICGFANSMEIRACIVGDKNINVSLSGAPYIAGFVGISNGATITDSIANNVSIYVTAYDSEGNVDTEVDSFCAVIDESDYNLTMCEFCAFIGDISISDYYEISTYRIPFRQDGDQYSTDSCYCAINYSRIAPDEYMIDQAYVQKQYKLYNSYFINGYLGVVEDFNFGMMIDNEFIPMPIPKNLIWIADSADEGDPSYLEQYGFKSSYDAFDNV